MPRWPDGANNLAPPGDVAPRGLDGVLALLPGVQEAARAVGLFAGLLSPEPPLFVQFRVPGGDVLLEYDLQQRRARVGMTAAWRPCKTWELALAAAVAIRAELETEERRRLLGEQPAAGPAEVENGESAGAKI